MREYELRDAMRETAKTIAAFDPNPSTWLRSLTALLQDLEQQSRGGSPMYAQIYEDMLKYLQDSIRNRLRTGGW